MPYETIAAAEAALGRNLTVAEALWFRYSAQMPDNFLYYHNYIFLLIIFTLVPLPLVFLELRLPSAVVPYKLQPKVQLPPASFFKCYKDVMRVFLLVVGPMQLFSYPSIKVSLHPFPHLLGLPGLGFSFVICFLGKGRLFFFLGCIPLFSVRFVEKTQKDVLFFEFFYGYK